MRQNPKEKLRGGLRRDDFEVDSLLGEGALCRVYLARNIHDNQRVALKVIQKQKIPNNTALQMILSERKIMTKLDQHPNIISLVCTFQDESYLYFVLDYVSGGCLSDTLMRYSHEIDTSLSFYWVCDVVNILTYLRSKNIAHRDIKNDNLMLDDYRRLRLVDFNSAAIVESSNTVPIQEEVVGTLPYLPPELMYQICPKLFRNDTQFKTLYADWLQRQATLLPQLKEASPFASDIWASGCVIFELLCGYHPFRGCTDIETVFNVLEYRLTIPNYLTEYQADLLRSLLNPVPDERLGVYDISELRSHAIFSDIDLESVAYSTDRPSLMKNSSAICPSSTGNPADIYEFTPDIGCSFGGVALGLVADSCGDPSIQYTTTRVTQTPLHHKPSSTSHRPSRNRGYHKRETPKLQKFELNESRTNQQESNALTPKLSSSVPLAPESFCSMELQHQADKLRTIVKRRESSSSLVQQQSLATSPRFPSQPQRSGFLIESTENNRQQIVHHRLNETESMDKNTIRNALLHTNCGCSIFPFRRFEVVCCPNPKCSGNKHIYKLLQSMLSSEEKQEESFVQQKLNISFGGSNKIRSLSTEGTTPSSREAAISSINSNSADCMLLDSEVVMLDEKSIDKQNISIPRGQKTKCTVRPSSF